MRLPTTVIAILGDQTVRLHPDGASRWTYRELVVVIRERESRLAIEVEAPGVRLSEVTLRWNMKPNASSLILNGHWERFYGDASWHTSRIAEILPWYFMDYGGGATAGYGVKPACRSIHKK
jgi:hypothetical protein